MKKHRNDMSLLQFNIFRFLQIFNFIILLAIFGCSSESGGDEDTSGGCRILRYHYDLHGNVIDIEDQGSCDCEGYIPGEGVTMVCDAIYDSFDHIIRGCVCEDEGMAGDADVRFNNTLDCNGESYTAIFEVCGTTLSSETGNWSSCETVNSGNCTWTLSANTDCYDIDISGPITINSNCLYNISLIISTINEGQPTMSYWEECPGDC